MGRKMGGSDWEQSLEYGESVIDNDFEDAASSWCDALESVPEEDFDTLYLRMLDSMERSFVQQAWKTTEGMDFCGLDELATMVRIYSPDTYEMLPELISRIYRHMDDMKRFDYVSELLDMALLFARTHFCVDTYLDSFSGVCGSMISFCDDAISRKDAIYQYNRDEEYMEGFIQMTGNLKAVFLVMRNAIDREIGGIGYEEVLRIGFDWMDTEERPYADIMQNIIDMRLDMSDSDEYSIDIDSMERKVTNMMDVYMKRPKTRGIAHKLQA